MDVVSLLCFRADGIAAAMLGSVDGALLCFRFVRIYLHLSWESNDEDEVRQCYRDMSSPTWRLTPESKIKFPT